MVLSTSVSSNAPRLAVVGGGVVGLGVGWRLAQAGWAVDVFDAGKAGREASWAAAGMLAAGVETEPGEDALLPLLRRGQAAWPSFAKELLDNSGQDVGYRDEGTLVVGLTQDDMARLRAVGDFQVSRGVALEWLSGRALRRLEPSLAPNVVGGVLSRADHQVDNRALVEALRAALLEAGGRLHEETAVERILIGDGRAEGVETRAGRHAADHVLLAGGAWSRTVPGLPAEIRPPIRPIKGQMLALTMDPRAPLLRHVLWAPKIYLVPRRSGRLVIGATVEERGFDRRMTAGGVLSLLEAAWRVLPSIEELPIEEMWVGFRPGTPDDAPIIGPTGVKGLVIATGHHRNGILLAPLTIDATARLIRTGERDAAIEGFGLERFGGGNASREAGPASMEARV